MPEKGVELGWPAPEGDERFERGPAAAPRQDLVAETGARVRRQDAGLLEEAVRVGRQDFRPLVAVVAGRVAAREDVAECVHESVVVRFWYNRDFPTNGVENRLRRRKFPTAVGV